MKIVKKILLLMLAVLVGMQFIQTARNESGQILSTDISKVFVVPENVLAALKTSCYDCHSNNTRYPWYSFIQPGAWWMAWHIKHGKADLNFSEFGNYTKRKQQNKLRFIVKSIEDETMPFPSYTFIHTNSKLSKENAAMVVDWATKIKDSLSQKE
jgi:hypothetical protein